MLLTLEPDNDSLLRLRSVMDEVLPRLFCAYIRVDESDGSACFLSLDIDGIFKKQ